MNIKTKIIISVVAGIILGILFIMYVNVTCQCNTMTLVRDKYGIHRFFGLAIVVLGLIFINKGWSGFLISLGVADMIFHLNEYLVISKC